MSSCLRIPAGTVVGLSARQVAMIVFAETAIIAHWRRAGLVADDLRSLLDELRVVAAEYRLAPASDPVSDPVPIFDGAAAWSAGSQWTSTRRASERLGISQRRVVQLLHEGRLTGRQQDTNSAWQVHTRSITAYLSMSEAADDRSADWEDESDADDGDRPGGGERHAG